MKAIITVFAATIFYVGTTSFTPAGTCKLNVQFSFKGIVEGYDHNSKTSLFVDGEQVAESSVKKESEHNSFTAKVPRGNHHVKIVNYAYYDNEWEEHTVDNEFSIDCKYEADMKLKRKKNITLLFDLDNGTQVVK